MVKDIYGITSRKPEERWKNGQGYKRQYVYKAIEKYKWHNIEHRILYTNLSQKEAEEKEREIIKEYSSNLKEYGYNVDNGGMCSGHHSESTRKKLSIIASKRTGNKNPFYGKKHSPKIKKIIKEKVGIKILQYDMQGNFIKEWESQNDIFKELNIDRKSIRLCCNGVYKQAGGYVWARK